MMPHTPSPENSMLPVLIILPVPFLVSALAFTAVSTAYILSHCDRGPNLPSRICQARDRIWKQLIRDWYRERGRHGRGTEDVNKYELGRCWGFEWIWNKGSCLGMVLEAKVNRRNSVSHRLTDTPSRRRNSQCTPFVIDRYRNKP